MKEFIKKGKYYYCPYDCGDSRFPSPRWKTEKGAQKHVDNCSMRPEEVEKRKLKDAERKEADLKKQSDQLELDKIKLQTAKYKVGDKISFVHSFLSKPTHEQRGNRMVKVRYEDEYSFTARTMTIDKVSCFFGRIIYNDYCYESTIEDSFELAEIEATRREESHLSANKLSSDLR